MSKRQVLEKLKFDPSIYSYDEKIKFIEEGKYLSALLKDTDPFVRRHLAKIGYGVDYLVNDYDWGVRFSLARHGHCLDVLLFDRDEDVCRAALDTTRRLHEMNLIDVKIIKKEIKPR